MKKLLTLICVASIFLTTTLPVEAVAWRGFENIHEFVYGNKQGSRKLALIVTGIAIDKEETKTLVWEQSTELLSVTITTIKITEVIYGNAKAGENIEVVAFGHEGGPSPYSYSGPFLRIGREYLFSLHAPVRGRYTIGHPLRTLEIDSDGNVLLENYLGIDSVDVMRKFFAPQKHRLFTRNKKYVSPSDSPQKSEKSDNTPRFSGNPSPQRNNAHSTRSVTR